MARPLQPRDPDHLARPHGEGHIGQPPVHVHLGEHHGRRPVGGNDRARRGGCSGRPPSIADTSSGTSTSAAHARQRDPPVPQDRHALREAHHLLQEVGDVQDGDAPVGQRAQDAFEAVDGGGRECRRGLVEDQQSGRRSRARAISVNCWSASGSSPSSVRVHVQAEFREDRAGRPVHGAPVQQAQAQRRMLREEVLPHGEVGEEAQLLGDDGDPGVLRPSRTVPPSGRSVPDRMRTSVDFPARSHRPARAPRRRAAGSTLRPTPVPRRRT
jgi:hypothetical protein